MKYVLPSPPYCGHCRRTMTLVRVVPKLGGMPQLETYRCDGCGDVQTIELLHRVSAAEAHPGRRERGPAGLPVGPEPEAADNGGH